jgi:hypothetical protein
MVAIPFPAGARAAHLVVRAVRERPRIGRQEQNK